MGISGYQHHAGLCSSIPTYSMTINLNQYTADTSTLLKARLYALESIFKTLMTIKKQALYYLILLPITFNNSACFKLNNTT